MKNQGYLLEFIANNGYDSNVYYECGKEERDQIMRAFSSKEVRDRTDCQVSWEEYTKQCHDANLFDAI
jgi:hypothetical protein